jgi:hypothetical protein
MTRYETGWSVHGPDSEGNYWATRNGERKFASHSRHAVQQYVEKAVREDKSVGHIGTEVEHGGLNPEDRPHWWFR